MKNLIVLFLLIASPCFADCPKPSVPPEQRVRIVLCEDESYAIEYQASAGVWGIEEKCGRTLQWAQARKAALVLDAMIDDALSCPSPPSVPKTPRVVVR